MGEGNVEPRRFGRRRFAAAPRPGPAEELVEPEYLLGGGGLVDDRGQPAPGALTVAESEEEEALVVLVEAGQHVALDVVQVDLWVARRLRVAVRPGARWLVARRVVEAAPRGQECSQGRARAARLQQIPSTQPARRLPHRRNIRNQTERRLNAGSESGPRFSVAVDRRALLPPSAHGLLEVLGGQPHVELGVSLVVHVRIQAAGIEARPEEPLGDLDSYAAEADDAIRDLVASRKQLVVVHCARYEADALRFGGVDVAARQHDVERPRRPDRARQQVAEPELGRGEPVVDPGGAEVGALGREPDVAG